MKRNRDLAGMAACELSFQYILLRQDRSYHFVQFLTAIFFVLFVIEFTLTITIELVIRITPRVCHSYMYELSSHGSSLLLAVSLCALLLIRASKKRFQIEPGEVMIERVNREVLEPCLGLKFDLSSGKLYSDHLSASGESLGGFYDMRYQSNEEGKESMLPFSYTVTSIES